MAVKRIEIPAVSGRGKDIRKKESGWVRQINTMYEVGYVDRRSWVAEKWVVDFSADWRTRYVIRVVGKGVVLFTFGQVKHHL